MVDLNGVYYIYRYMSYDIYIGVCIYISYDIEHEHMYNECIIWYIYYIIFTCT